MKNPIYLIARPEDYATYPEALEALKDNPGMRITYRIPSPEYKSWVPLWLIRLIIKR